MFLAVVVIQHTVFFRDRKIILVLYLPLHGICPHLPPRIITFLLNVLRQPEHILHVLHVRRYSVAYLVQGICHLVLDVVPEPRLALTLLGALGYELLYSVIEPHRVLAHTLLYVGSKLSIHRIVQVHPKTSHVVIELVSQQSSHALVSYGLVPDGLLRSVGVVDIRHVKMHLTCILVIPARHLLAVLNVTAHLIVANLLNRIHHLHLTTSLLHSLVNSLTNPLANRRRSIAINQRLSRLR